MSLAVEDAKDVEGRNSEEVGGRFLRLEVFNPVFIPGNLWLKTPEFGPQNTQNAQNQPLTTQAWI